MRVLWPHNYNPSVPNAGVFMFAAAQALTRRGIAPELLYVGDLRSPTGVAKARDDIRRAARSADIVHTQYGSAVSWCAGAVRDRPLVMSLRGSDWTPARARGAWRAHSWLSGQMTRRALRRFDLVLAVSHRIATEVRQHSSAMDVIVAPDPIDLELFKPRDRAEARSRLGLDPGAKYALFTTISRQNPLKRMPLASRSVELAQQRVPELELLVAAEYSHSEMPYVVAAADVALCTSVAEGWPNSMKEALACNIPFVATDVSDLARIAQASPVCSIAGPEPESLADAIVRTITTPGSVGDLRRHVADMNMGDFADTLLARYERLMRSAPWNA